MPKLARALAALEVKSLVVPVTVLVGELSQLRVRNAHSLSPPIVGIVDIANERVRPSLRIRSDDS